MGMGSAQTGPSVRSTGAEGTRAPARSWIGPWCGSWRGPVALIALCLTVILPGFFSLPAIDRDEARFAQASRQMFESCDFVVPRVQDRPRLNKPPLIYWLQAGAAALCTGGDPLQDAIWMYRIPGALCTIGSVLLTYSIGMRIFDARAAWLGAAMLAVCPLVVVDAHQARADQLLLFCTTATMACLWRVLESRGRCLRWVIAMWLCCGLGILAKGPVTPLVLLLTIAAMSAWKRDWSVVKWSRAWWGLPLALACVLPWVLLVAQRVGAQTYFRTIYDETIGRTLEAKESHKGPPGYYLVLLVALFFPGSLLTGNAFARAVGKGTRKGARFRWIGSDAELFLLCWTIPSWIVFELVMTKLPHYPMPLFPAIALLTARWTLVAGAHFRGALPRPVLIGAYIWTIVGAVLVGGGTVFISVSIADISSVHGLGVAGGAVAVLAMIAAGMYALRGAFQRAVTIAGLAWIGVVILLLGVTLPMSKSLWISRDIADSLKWLEPENPRTPVFAFGYHEDSMVFETRGRVQRVPASGFDPALAPQGSAWFVWSSDHQGRLPLGWRNVTDVEECAGFNYSTGKAVRVFVARRVREVRTEQDGIPQRSESAR